MITTLTKLTSHPGVERARQRCIGVRRRLLWRLLRVHGLLVHGRHLRLVLHVVHWVHEVLLVHTMLHHVLLGVHVVRHLLSLLQRGAARNAARHAARRSRRRLQFARRVYRGRRGLMSIRPVPVRLGTHVAHLSGTIGPVAVLLHLLVVAEPVVGRKPRVWHARCGLRGVVVLRRPQLLVAAVHLVALLRHGAIVRVRLLVLMPTAVPHIRHGVGVGEVCHTIAVIGAHRGPAARAARVRIFRCRYSAVEADTITDTVTTQTLRIPFTTRRRSNPLMLHAMLDDASLLKTRRI